MHTEKGCLEVAEETMFVTTAYADNVMGLYAQMMNSWVMWEDVKKIETDIAGVVGTGG